MTAHDIPDSPEIRARFDDAQQAALVSLGLDATTVAGWEDGYRSQAVEADAFEWWYLDMQFDDGSTLVTTFFNKPHTDPHGPVAPGVLVIHRAADGTRIKETVTVPSTQWSAATDACDVTIGASTLSGDLATYRLHLASDRVTADLTMTRRCPSWRPGAGVNYFNEAKTHYMGWVVPVPYGTIEGTVVIDGQERAVTGAGYHDHNWGNHEMGDALDHWYWGRAHIGDYTVVYVRMTTKGVLGLGQINLPTFLLATQDRVITDDLLPLRLETSGDVPGPGGQTYPTDLLWTWQTDAGSIRMHVTHPQLIEALDMTEGQPEWRRFVTHLTAHPMYYDFTAEMELSIDLDGVRETVRGHTLYEKMMFR